MIKDMWNDLVSLYKYRELLKQLVIRDLKVRYKRSVIGFMWSMLNPLLTMVVLNIVFSNLFKSNIHNYIVYVLSGLLFWNFFSQSTSAAMMSIVGYGGLIKKIYVPKLIYPISVVLSALINMILAIIPIFILMMVLKVQIKISVIFLPVSMLIIFLFSCGVSLIIATLNVFFRDITHIYGVMLMALMYMTPIMYPLEIIPDNYLEFLIYNPFIGLLSLFRSPLYDGTIPEVALLVKTMVLAIATFVIGLGIFNKKQNDFINYI